MDTSLFPKLSDINSKSASERHFKNKWPDFVEYLNEHYPQDISFKERLYWYFNNIEDYPVCEVCGKRTTIINMNKGYHKYCCVKCGSGATREQAKQTKIEKYGDANFNNRDKAASTCMEKYGQNSPKLTEEQKKHKRKVRIERYGDYNNSAKAAQTKIEKYGDANYNNKEKAALTCMEKYGQEHYNNHDKCIQTVREKYGTDNVFQNENIKKKARQTMMERHGVEYAQQSLNIRETTKNNNLAKYGVEHPGKTEAVKDKLSKANRKHVLDTHDFINRIDDNGDWVCRCPHNNECNACNSKEYTIPMLVYFARKEFNLEPCTNLLPVKPGKNQGTTLELFVRKVLDDSNINYECNNRSILKGKELDIYIPDYNIAIECNGCFWHSRKIKDYHINKYNTCKDAEIQLLTLWEDWILTKPEIVKSVIRSKFGLFDHRIGARECTIKEVEPNKAVHFIEHNHIQGRTNANLYIGLYYKDELTSIMAFSKPSKTSGNGNIREGEWILGRFCTKLGWQIVGGADRLLKYFIDNHNPTKIVSFSSNDISNGDLYKKLNFVKEGDTIRIYWYVNKKNLTRYHRTSFTKTRLKALGYDVKDRTEEEIMESLPYYKIYDSGIQKWTLEINQK